MVQPAAMLYFPPAFPMGQAVKNTLGWEYRWVWLKTALEPLGIGYTTLTGPCDFSSIRTLASEIKAANRPGTLAIRPPVRVGLYAGGIGGPDSHHAGYDALADADLLHRPDGSVVGLAPHDPLAPLDRRVSLVNYARPETRRTLIAFWIAFLRAHNLDGVFFDTFNPSYYAGWASSTLGCPSGAQEGPIHTAGWWWTHLAAFVRELRWALETAGLEVWINGIADAPFVASDPLGDQAVNLADLASGVLDEHCHLILYEPGRFARFLERATAVNAKKGRAFYCFQPRIHVETFTPNVWAHRFFLGAYLLVQEAGRTFFGYHDGPAYRGFTETASPEAYVFSGGLEWEYDLGAPVGPFAWNTAGSSPTAIREYARAYVAVNAGTTPGRFAVPGTYRNWHPDAGTLIAIPPGLWWDVEPQSAMLLFKQAAP